MKFHKALVLAIVTFGLGILLGWWWHGFSSGPSEVPAIEPPLPRPKLVFVTTEFNKLRFSVVRISQAYMPDAKGNMNRFASVEVAVENAVDPATVPLPVMMAVQSV